MACSSPGLSVPHHLPKFAQVHVHCIGDAIQPSHPLMPSSPTALNLSQHQGLFQWVSCLHQMTKILEFQHQSFQWVFRVDFPWSPHCPRDSQESSLAPQFKGIRSSVLHLLYGPALTALTLRAFVGRVLSLLFNTLFRFLMAFLPRSKHLLISWLQSPSPVNLKPKKRKSVPSCTFFPFYFPWSNVAGCHDCSFFKYPVLNWLFQSPSSPSSRRSLVPLHLHLQRNLQFLFTTSHAVVSSACLRLLMFLLPVLIPACNPSSLVFLMMCSVYRLDKQGDRRQPCYTLFSILNQSVTLNNQIYI